LKYFQDNFPGIAVGYHIAGYREESKVSIPYVLVGHTIREPGLRRVNADAESKIQYGITRAGDTLIANRLIDSNHLPLFPAMPLQDAVDYAVHLIRSTIDTMRFEPRFPSVGGPSTRSSRRRHALGPAQGFGRMIVEAVRRSNSRANHSGYPTSDGIDGT
jgi:hypothetical protein